MSAMYSQLKELTFFGGEKDSFLDICDLIKSSFQRNKIPQNEWPNIPDEDFPYPQNIDKAIKSCLCEKEITGCLKKRGALHIFIDSSIAAPDTESKIRDTMVKNGVITCEAVFKYGNIQRFCSSGDIACSGTGCSGTLGGFVKIETTVSSETKPKTELDVDSVFALTAGNRSPAKAAEANQATQNTNPTSKEPLVALISRHVAMGNLNKYLCVGPHQRRLGSIQGMTFSETLDIYPVKIEDDKISLCDTRFRTEYGDPMHAYRNIVDSLRGANVHLWGKRISPGLGIIVEKDIQGGDGNTIIIRNRYQNKEFAKPGDSGAMVCYFDAHSEQLYAVAMLIGPYLTETTPVLYIAQVLDDALCVLSTLNNCTLDLCGKNSNE